MSLEMLRWPGQRVSGERKGESKRVRGKLDREGRGGGNSAHKPNDRTRIGDRHRNELPGMSYYFESECSRARTLTGANVYLHQRTFDTKECWNRYDRQYG